MYGHIKNLEDHSRTIIHLDLDCFYAQVEMIKNPSLREVPLGIQQKNIIVTSNYVAREYGVKKCMLLTDAKRCCPDLTIVNGEDLYEYRQTSNKVTNFLHKYSNLVERLGLDENFIDVTSLVEERMKSRAREKVVGNVFGDTSEQCQCGCEARLIEGTHIAQEIRDSLHEELQLTSCAGISHNKLLAKIVGSRHKPNQQTVLFPNSAVELMSSLGNVVNIPGIGKATAELLESVNIRTVSDLQVADISVVEGVLGKEKAKTVQRMSYGIDSTPVKNSGRPQSIGLEDSCRTVSAEKEVREKLQELLSRLLILVHEDGRLPRTLKLTIRKFDKKNKISHRESRQCNLSPSLFNSFDVTLTPYNLEKTMNIIMTLFTKMVNVKMPYHITLLGLSFTKFNEKPNLRNSLATFLKQNIEVQSVTCIENLRESSPSPCSSTDSSPSMSNLYLKTSNLNLEPVCKKSKLNLIVKRKCDSDLDDCASPSKLRVDELYLHTPEKHSDDNQNVFCPPNADPSVFKELPFDVQKELWQDYRSKSKSPRMCIPSKKPKPNSLLNYFSKV